MTTVTEHRLKNELAATRQIEQIVGDFARLHLVPRGVQQALDLALVEWVTNVISYGYDDSREHLLTLRLNWEEGEARAEVEDDGRAYNPLTRPPVDTSAPLETRAIGGLGIHMIRQLMDTVEYRRADGRNILTLVKRWS